MQNHTFDVGDGSFKVIEDSGLDAVAAAAADQAAIAEAAAAPREADRLTVRAIITDLQAEKARAQAVIDTPNATIKSNPAPYVNDVARAAKRIADAAIDLARYAAP